MLWNIGYSTCSDPTYERFTIWLPQVWWPAAPLLQRGAHFRSYRQNVPPAASTATSNRRFLSLQTLPGCAALVACRDLANTCESVNPYKTPAYLSSCASYAQVESLKEVRIGHEGAYNTAAFPFLGWVRLTYMIWLK